MTARRSPAHRRRVPHLTVLDHPLIQHRLSQLRARDTAPAAFRRGVRDLGLLLGYEATRDLALTPTRIATPLEVVDAPHLASVPCLVAILRAGLGLVDGMLDLLPEAPVGHIGLYRDPATLRAVEYTLKLPPGLADRTVILADPMLATGHTAIAAVARLRAAGAMRIRLACLLAAPEGVAAMAAAHPDVPIYTCALDRALDAHAYIRPGLGDAGDRLFGTI